VPGAQSDSIKEAAETIPGVSARHIQRSLSYLLLPDELQNALDNGDLKRKTIGELVKFRTLGNVERMHLQWGRTLAGCCYSVLQTVLSPRVYLRQQTNDDHRHLCLL
jgi:hypothetical protein